MTRETEHGIAYLMALKADTGAGAATRRDAAEDGATAGGSFAGAEKRRSRRFQCQGSAEFHPEGTDIRTWATFADISLHGCYVEAQATYPVGALLHMKLDVNDIRVEGQGIVRVCYPSLGMGIAFADLTPINTAELRRLLAGIARPNFIVGPGTASSLPSATRTAAPAVDEPAAALRELIEFFENRQMMTREDFLRILKKSRK